MLVTLVPRGGRAGATVGIREARAVVVAGALAIAATAWFGRDLSQLAAQPVVFGLAYLAFAVAVAIRFGAIPFHLWAARLTDVVPETALPILTALAPGLAGDRRPGLDRRRRSRRCRPTSTRSASIVLAIAVASIVLAAVAAFVQDDLEHVLGYSIVGDAGVVILALAVARARRAGRRPGLWILAFVVARSAFAAWAAGIRAGLLHRPGRATCAAGRGARRSSPSRSSSSPSPASASRVWPPSTPGRRSSTWRVDPAAGDVVLSRRSRRSSTTGGCSSIGLSRPDRVGEPVDARGGRAVRPDRT